LAARLAPPVPEPVARFVMVPVAAQLACGPVVALLAPGLTTYAVPANLLAAPAVVPATVLGVLAALVAPWWEAGGAVLARGAGWAAWWVAATARLFAGLPGAQLPWPAPPVGPVLLVVATLGVVVALVRPRRRPEPDR
jgi:competence protein ComEC